MSSPSKIYPTRIGISFCFMIIYGLFHICHAAAHKGNPGVGSLTVKQEFKRSTFTRDTILINRYNALARRFLFSDGEKTISYARKALLLSHKNDWDLGKLQTYNWLSSCYLLNGSFDIFHELSTESIKLSQKLHLPVYTAYSQRFLAESYTEYKDWKKALPLYESALKTFEQYGEDSARALCLENLGNFYREQNMLKQAVDYYQKAIALNEKLGMPNGKASVLLSQGYMHVRHGEYRIAEKFLLESLRLYTKTGNIFGQTAVWNDLANCYQLDKQYLKAIDCGQKAFDKGNVYHSSQQINWALLVLAKANKAMNNLPKAIEYMEKVNFNKRLLHEELIQREFTMSQLIFDNKRMDGEIQEQVIEEQRRIQIFLVGFLLMIVGFAVFLWRTNSRLRRKNKEIKEALIQGQTIERKRVAAELHDHLGGTLAALNWYLYGINKKVLSDEERRIYESVHSQVVKAYRELRSISHNLMPEELEQFGLILTITKLIERLNQNEGIKFEFEHNGLSSRLNNKVEFELYSIILELTNNILKHSNATQAKIILLETNSTLKLSISDNGKGIKWQAGTGMGLGNVRNRVQSLSATLEIKADKGTQIDVEVSREIMY